MAIDTTSTQVLNIAKQESQGLELETVAELTDNLQLSLSYAYIDAENTEWPGFNTNTAGVLVPRKNEPVSGAPENMVGAMLRYNMPFIPSEMGKVSATLNYKWLDDHFIGYGSTMNAESEMVKSYDLVDLRLDWENINGHPVDIGFFVKNATDEVYPTVNATVMRFLGVTGWAFGAPRTYGFEVRARFGASAQ